MINLEIAEIFKDIARILEIKGENVFRIRAYTRAAQNIEGFPNLESYIKQGRLTDIPGIGHDLSEMIKEYAATGKIKTYEELKKALPAGLLNLLNIPSIGPKTAKLLYEEAKIKDIAGLEEAIKRGKLTGLAGIKEKTIENIKKGIEILKRGKERMTLAQATLVADEFISELKKMPQVKKISPAGSLRRQKDTVRDIDILITSKEPEKIIGAFIKLGQVRDVLAKGRTKASVRTNEDVQVDCRVLEERAFGAALLYFTGSKDFNIKLRQIAIKKNLKLNEYGLFSAAGGSASGGKEQLLAGKTEEEMFKTLGLSYIEPELRENTGEIELARKGALPHLVELKDIKGDLHAHTNYSDGASSIREMADAAIRRGYSYIALTDHSESLKVAGGLNTAELKKKRDEIAGVNKELKNFRVLFGTEVEIGSTGKIDYKDEVLEGFDIVVAAIHTGFKQSKEQLTKRIILACKNKHVNIIAHPTGKLWGSRDAYEIDFEEILKVARDTNTHLEINAFPNRLDLNDKNCRRAKEAGVKIAISTDSHEAKQLDAMKFGISVARRAWLAPEDVINTLPLEKLLKIIKK
ncbi:MAG: DNA polymerase/3'-5' exonuclease PolX [Candidatus Omnitrophica bacterium]|nr:DNA polymerase/3'-5' exonuclease PolX [Candidatus Omnitrophota bacterium]